MMPSQVRDGAQDARRRKSSVYKVANNSSGGSGKEEEKNRVNNSQEPWGHYQSPPAWFPSMAKKTSPNARSYMAPMPTMAQMHHHFFLSARTQQEVPKPIIKHPRVPA
jgi:hypothetical protein